MSFPCLMVDWHFWGTGQLSSRMSNNLDLSGYFLMIRLRINALANAMHRQCFLFFFFISHCNTLGGTWCQSWSIIGKAPFEHTFKVVSATFLHCKLTSEAMWLFHSQWPFSNGLSINWGSLPESMIIFAVTISEFRFTHVMQSIFIGWCSWVKKICTPLLLPPF